MRIHQEAFDDISAGRLPPRDAIAIEKRLLELAALQAANDAVARVQNLPRDRKITFCDFAVLTVCDDLSKSCERFFFSKTGLRSAGTHRSLIGKFSQPVIDLIEKSEQCDPANWHYHSKISAAILSFLINSLRTSSESAERIETAALEIQSGQNLSDQTAFLARNTVNPTSALEMLKLHKGAVRLTPDRIELLPPEHSADYLPLFSIDFKAATKRELRIFIAQWKKFNRRDPKPNNSFADGSPICKIPLDKSIYFAHMLERALTDKFSILPDARLAPADLLARRIEDRHDLRVFTKSIQRHSNTDNYAVLSLEDLRVLDRFLDQTSVLKQFFDRVIKIDPRESFNGSAADLNEIMRLRLYRFTFQNLTSGSIRNYDDSRSLGVLVNPTRNYNQVTINYRKGPRAMPVSSVSLAALATGRNDYMELVFLELTQSASLQLQLDRESFNAAWNDNIAKVVRKVSTQLKIPEQSSRGPILSILIGRVLLDVQRALNGSLEPNFTAEQRDWITLNLGVVLDSNGRVTKALPQADSTD